MAMNVRAVFTLALGLLCGGCDDGPSSSMDDEELVGTGCSDAMCESGLRVVLVSSGSFIPGNYRVSSVADGQVRSCTFRVGGTETCGMDAPCLLADECDAQINLVAPPHSVAVVIGPGAPEVVSVNVERGGTPIAGFDLEPDYEEFAPAGPDCPPICDVAEVLIDIP